MIMQGTTNGEILIVDDDPLITSIIGPIIEAIGFSSISCMSGAEALNIADERKGTIKLMMIDVHLEDMTGYEFDTKLEQRLGRCKPKAIVMSSHSQERVQSKFPNWKIDNHLRKPFTSEALIEAVERILLTDCPPV